MMLVVKLIAERQDMEMMKKKIAKIVILLVKIVMVQQLITALVVSHLKYYKKEDNVTTPVRINNIMIATEFVRIVR